MRLSSVGFQTRQRTLVGFQTRQRTLTGLRGLRGVRMGCPCTPTQMALFGLGRFGRLSRIGRIGDTTDPGWNTGEDTSSPIYTSYNSPADNTPSLNTGVPDGSAANPYIINTTVPAGQVNSATLNTPGSGAQNAGSVPINAVTAAGSAINNAAASLLPGTGVTVIGGTAISNSTLLLGGGLLFAVVLLSGGKKKR